MMDVESLSSEDLRTIANERLDSHCFKEAIVLFRILLERKPDDADALNCYGVALLGLGRYREALDAFDAALAITEKPISLKTTPASLSGLSMRDIPKTAAGSTTLAYVFDNADIWFNRGIVLSKMGRYAEAIRSYDRALAIDPDDTDIWRNRGDTLGAWGRNEDAVASYDRVLSIDPEDSGVWTSRGLSLGALGRHEEAIKSFEQALVLDPLDLDAWIGHGLTLHDLEHYSDAVASYDRALAIDPDGAEVWYNRGRAS